MSFFAEKKFEWIQLNIVGFAKKLTNNEEAIVEVSEKKRPNGDLLLSFEANQPFALLTHNQFSKYFP